MTQRLRNLDYSGQPFGRPGGHMLKGLKVRLGLAGITTNATLLGQDAITARLMSGGLDVYGGYVSGDFANYTSVVEDFPGKKYVGIAPFIAPTDCLDVEPGDSTPGDCPAFYRQATHPNLNKPMFYTSGGDLQAVINEMSGAGIARSSYYLWSAHWIGKHICSPATCGLPQADGTQYASNDSYDSDVFYAYIFRGAPVPTNPSLPLSQGDVDVTANGPVHTVQANLNKWAAEIALSPLLSVDGNFGAATRAAVVLALKYWNYSAANVALAQVDQSLYNHLADTPGVPPLNQTGTIVSLTTGGSQQATSTNRGWNWTFNGPASQAGWKDQVGIVTSDQTKASAYVVSVDGGITWGFAGTPSS